MKRCFDIAISIVLGVVLLPLYAFIALMIVLLNGRPVMFFQDRPGIHGDLFCLYKFRTMVEGKTPDGDRLTELGRLLRRLSLDELPQLWNVLLGDMSLVGPRPLLKHYLPLYSDRQSRRHEIRPGVTGWAQINGRNIASWEDRLEMDVWYVEHHSFALDLRIILQTVFKVISGDGVNAKGKVAVGPFKGSTQE